MSIYKNAILEHARVSIKEKKLETYRNQYSDFSNAVNELNGNLGISTWQNINKPTEIVDLGVWQNIEAAQKADALVQESKDFAQFFDPMESVDSF
jgi:quinol monooxygenase YgiN